MNPRNNRTKANTSIPKLDQRIQNGHAGPGKEFTVHYRTFRYYSFQE